MASRAALRRVLADPQRRTQVSIAALTAGVLGLGLLHVGSRSLWLDEATSVDLARADSTTFWSGLRTQGGAVMPLYFVLLRAWTSIGTGEAAVRSLSVVCAAATVPLVYALVARLFGRRAAVGAAALFAVNAFVLQYAQEARGYTLVCCLSTAATLLFVRAVDHGGLRSWVAYTTVATLAVWAHLAAVLVVMAHLTALILRWPGRRVLQAGAVAAAIVAVLAYPFIHANLAGAGALDWIPRRSPASEVGGVVWAFTNRSTVVLLLTLVAIAAAVAAVATPRGRPLRWGMTVTLCWLVVPIVALTAVALVRPAFLDRYLIISLPPLVIVTALGLTALPWRRLGVAALVAAVVLSVPAILDWYGQPALEDWRAVESYVVPRATPADALIFDAPWYREPFDYYLQRDDHRGGHEPAQPNTGPERTLTLPPGHRRVWLVVASFSIARTWRLGGYAQVDRHDIETMRVYLFQNREPRSPAAG